MQAPVALPRCFAEILCSDFGFGSLREFRPRCRSFTVIHQILPQNCASSVRKIYSQITLVQLCGIALNKTKWSNLDEVTVFVNLYTSSTDFSTSCQEPAALSSERYCRASARCSASMTLLSARSAIVRATRSTRSCARAVSPSR